MPDMPRPISLEIPLDSSGNDVLTRVGSIPTGAAMQPAVWQQFGRPSSWVRSVRLMIVWLAITGTFSNLPGQEPTQSPLDQPVSGFSSPSSNA
jgi:hypothetical protein